LLAAPARHTYGGHGIWNRPRRMTRVAPLNPNRFTSAIPHYINGRPPYAERLVARLAHEAGLDARSRVLDLGCGPGSLTLPLARYCGTTIGIDADAAMIAAARAAAASAGVDIDWRVGTSFDLGSDLAPLDLVTIARAFHWMDRDATLQRLDALIAPGGAVALINTELHDAGPVRWHAAFEDLRKGHGRFDDFYHWRKSEAWEEHTSVLLRSPFSEVERISVFEARTATLEELVARALSFSANSPAALGEDGRAVYEAAVRQRMLAIAPAGDFAEIVESVAIIARRPSA
jgi:2-polyprenyl-3-methyl-5-hydroxy-6-metoxy-1,4-benzoquinol methylase